MKKILIISGIVLTITGIAIFASYKIQHTVKPSDYTKNRRKIKSLRRITIKRVTIK